MLKLYFYGYLNGIRSCRRLEKECKRNIELQWLMQKLMPNYHTKADFRKVNPGALKNTFKLFLSSLKDMGLVAVHTVAVNGTKVRVKDHFHFYIELFSYEFPRQFLPACQNTK